ncbi:MAG: hypothetical protein HOY78_34665 [Saccharothrix sp.]|nr:hypothetical protein [Saccharothrix sp.]
MKKFASTASLLVVLVAATVVPAASAEPPPAPAPPVACAGLVQQLSDTLKTIVAKLTGVPPAPSATAVPLGEVVGLLGALQGARCLPTPAVGAAGAVPVAHRASEQCLSNTLNVFAATFGVLSAVVPGAPAVADVPALLKQLGALLKNLGDALKNCGLPEPAGGLPTVPSTPV